jgi:hypothetical protein
LYIVDTELNVFVANLKTCKLRQVLAGSLFTGLHVSDRIVRVLHLNAHT